jgi:hypothetical protein
MPQYTIEQVNIDDEVVYENKYTASGTSAGKVIGKIDKSILLIAVKDTGKGYLETAMIDVSKIKVVTGK